MALRAHLFALNLIRPFHGSFNTLKLQNAPWGFLLSEVFGDIGELTLLRDKFWGLQGKKGKEMEKRNSAHPYLKKLRCE